MARLPLQLRVSRFAISRFRFFGQLVCGKAAAELGGIQLGYFSPIKNYQRRIITHSRTVTNDPAAP